MEGMGIFQSKCNLLNKIALAFKGIPLFTSKSILLATAIQRKVDSNGFQIIIWSFPNRECLETTK